MTWYLTSRMRRRAAATFTAASCPPRTPLPPALLVCQSDLPRSQRCFHPLTFVCVLSRIFGQHEACKDFLAPANQYFLCKLYDRVRAPPLPQHASQSVRYHSARPTLLFMQITCTRIPGMERGSARASRTLRATVRYQWV